MRNAALTLGIIGGLIGMVIGFFSYGWTELVAAYDIGETFQNEQLIRVMSILAPVLALAGGAMASARALWGGVLLLISAGGMLFAFGFNPFTMFPIVLTGLGGLLAVAAGKPDEPKAHF